MIDWLKPILGDGYNEEIDNKIAAEINKGFVAKADYDAAKDAQRTAAEALADANKALAEYKDTDIDGLRKAVQPDEWQTAYADADALIRRYERLYRVEYPTDSARDTAVCAIADAQRRFADVQSGAAAAPASVTIGSVSESYAANTAAAIDATPKAQAAEYYRILCLYADVYRGCS